LDFKKHISDFILNSGFIGCLVIDRDANMVYTNEVFDDLMRGIEGSVQGLNMIEVLRPEEQESIKNLVENLFNQGSIPKTEWEIINRLDEKIYLDFEGSLIEENGTPFGLCLVIDRSEERILRKELEYSNNQRKLAIKTGKLGIWKLNLKTGTNLWNDELLDIYELTREEWAEDINGWQNLVHPEDFEIADKELQRSVLGEYVFDVRFRIKTKSGKTKHIYASAGPFFDEEGNVVEVHGVNIDVTQLVETEQQAFIQEQYFKNITEKLPGLVVQYYINPDGTDGINYLSKGVEELYGLDHEEASKDVSLIWNQVIPEDVPEVTASLQESAANMTDWESTFRIYDTHGNLKYVRTVGSPEKDENGKITWDIIALDVTEYVQLNNAIKEQQQQIENVNNKIPGLVLQYFINKDGTDGLTYLSDGVKKVYGIEQSEAFENVGLIWERILPEYLPDMAASIQKSAETMEDWDHIFEAVDVNGNKKYLRGLGTPHKGDDGRIIWDTLTLDITKQVLQEKEIWEKNIQLQNFTDQLPGVALRYYLKPDGSDGLLFLSKGVEEIYEVNRDEVINDVSLMWNQIHVDDIPEMQSSIEESAKNLTRWENVHRIITPSGKTKYLSSVGTPRKNNDGTIVWDTISMDITSQIESDTAVRESQEMLDQLTNQVPGLVYIYQLHPDGSDRFLYQSKGIEDIFEIKQEDALNDTSLVWKCIHPEDVPTLTESVQKSAADLSNWNNVYRIITPSGKLKFIQGSGSPVKLEDGTIQWYSMGVDITEQIEQKDKFDTQRQQLENITGSIQGVVLKYQVHPDGTDSIPYISSRVNEYWGVDAETVTSDINKAWARVVPEDIDPTRKAVEKSIANMSEWSQIMRFVSSTGEIKHMRGYGLPKLLDDGSVEFDSVLVDVTEQELARQEAKEKERQLEVLGDQIPGVVFVYFRKPDGTDGFSYFSDGFEELHGIEKSKALENPKVLWDQVHPEDLPIFVNSMMESAANMSKLDFQYRIIRPDGEIRYLQGFGSPNMEEDGKIVWNAVNLDITDRKQAELEIADKSNQLQSITDQISGVVVRYQLLQDGSDEILFISDGVEDVYGITKEDAIADSSLIWSKYHPDDVKELQDSIQRSAETLQPWEHIYRYFNARGDIGYLQGFGTPQKMDDGTVIWDAITMDITKRMQAELEANRSSSKLRAFIKSSPIAIYQIDPNGLVTDFWNAAAEQVYGWTRDEVINNTLPTVTGDKQEEFLEIIEDIRISKKPKQFQVNRKNRYSEDIILEVTAGPLFDENEKLTDLLIIANDITELEEYRKTLEAALREKEILLQEIHHRVKNNLAIVSGLLELQALKDDSDRDMSLIIEARNRIHSIAMVHEQLYQDMDFSHINPKEYYKKLLRKLQANTTSTEYDISYDLKFEIDKININRAVPLGLLINELFTNSIKHAFVKGKGCLKLHFTQNGDNIRVFYEDDGPGFVIDDIKDKNTIGWQLIETLLIQLDSTYTMDTEGRFMLDFTFEEIMQGSQSHYT
jgi:PAS domain S-box-containing protein